MARKFDPLSLASTIAMQHQRNETFTPLASEICADLDAAYAVQENLIRLWATAWGPVTSWKVGLTTERMQEMCGVHQPIAGAVLENRVRASPAVVDRQDFGRLGIEAELAVRIGRTIYPHRMPDPEEMLDQVDAVSAAFELVDDRNADYSALDAVSLVADNSWNAGIVLAPAVPAKSFSTLLDLDGTLLCDGEVIETGVSQDAGGDPVHIVRWLAAALGDRGRALEAGQWVMTGSIVRTQFPVGGERYEFRLGNLPPAQVRIV